MIGYKRGIYFSIGNKKPQLRGLGGDWGWLFIFSKGSLICYKSKRLMYRRLSQQAYQTLMAQTFKY
jgi:hypothetical protein